jgi:hypothetical protein
MPNVYVEPRPIHRPAGTAITHYVLELEGGTAHAGARASYPTQGEAETHARQLGHTPLPARVRHTDKGDPDQWRKE